MNNHKKFKIYFKVLFISEKLLLRKITTHHNASKFMEVAQLILGKHDLLFINGQIQQCRESLYFVIIKSLLDVVLFSTLLAKKVLVISVMSRCLVIFWSSKSKSKLLHFINHERSVDESISEYFLRIFANRAVH